MILTFKEIGVNPSDYTGYTFAVARALIVNKACDHVMDSFRDNFYDMLYGAPDESYHIPYPADADVNMVQHTITMFVQQ